LSDNSNKLKETQEIQEVEDGEELTIICFENKDGKEEHFAVVDNIEHEGSTYCALVAYDIETDDFIDDGGEEQEFYIVKETVNGENTEDVSYEEIEDDELNNKLAEIFTERLEELFSDESESE
jgi:hypothetical protein